MEDAAPPSETAERRTLGSTILRIVGLVLAVALVGLLAYGLASQAPNDQIDDALARGESAPAPEFRLPVLQLGSTPSANAGGTVTRAVADGRVALSELRGTPVVLNFWASWCDPCRVEAPVLERAWPAAARRGVAFVGLDMQDLTSAAREFLREFDVSYLNVRDQDREVARRYGTRGLPETYFISARGNVVGHITGAIDPEQLREGIQAALSGRPVPARIGGRREEVR